MTSPRDIADRLRPLVEAATIAAEEKADLAPYAGVICMGHDYGVGYDPGCGNVDITHAEYIRQVMRPDSRWKCPKCGALAEFDDERYEEINFPDEE